MTNKLITPEGAVEQFDAIERAIAEAKASLDADEIRVTRELIRFYIALVEADHIRPLYVYKKYRDVEPPEAIVLPADRSDGLFRTYLDKQAMLLATDADANLLLVPAFGEAGNDDSWNAYNGKPIIPLTYKPDGTIVQAESDIDTYFRVTQVRIGLEQRIASRLSFFENEYERIAKRRDSIAQTNSVLSRLDALRAAEVI